MAHLSGGLQVAEGAERLLDAGGVVVAVGLVQVQVIRSQPLQAVLQRPEDVPRGTARNRSGPLPSGRTPWSTAPGPAGCPASSARSPGWPPSAPGCRRSPCRESCPPCSTNRSSASCAVFSSATQPKVWVPRQSSETFRPVDPKKRYSMVSPQRKYSMIAAHGPGVGPESRGHAPPHPAHDPRQRHRGPLRGLAVLRRDPGLPVLPAHEAPARRSALAGPRPLRAEQGPRRAGPVRGPGRGGLLPPGAPGPLQELRRASCRATRTCCSLPAWRCPRARWGRACPPPWAWRWPCGWTAGAPGSTRFWATGSWTRAASGRRPWPRRITGCSHLTAILDRNLLQVSGPTERDMRLEPVAAKWQAFGWEVFPVDGHDPAAILQALRAAGEVRDRPSILIARTVKGKGIPSLEGQTGGAQLRPVRGAVRRGAAGVGAMLKSTQGRLRRGPAAPGRAGPAGGRAGRRPLLLHPQRAVRRPLPGALLRDGHRRAEPVRRGRRAGRRRQDPLRQHLRRVRHGTGLQPDPAEHRLSQPEREDRDLPRRVHRLRGRGQPPVPDRRGPDALPAEHDRDRARRRRAGRAGGAGRGAAPRARLPAHGQERSAGALRARLPLPHRRGPAAAPGAGRDRPGRGDPARPGVARGRRTGAGGDQRGAALRAHRQAAGPGAHPGLGAEDRGRGDGGGAQRDRRPGQRGGRAAGRRPPGAHGFRRGERRVRRVRLRGGAVRQARADGAGDRSEGPRGAGKPGPSRYRGRA